MRWDVSIQEAKKIQEKLRSSIRLERLSAPRIIAGVDVSCNRFDPILYAGIVVVSFPDLRILETAFAKQKGTFPYVPGYLSFREIPVVLEAFKKMKTQPDVLCVDGQGVAHPRSLGIATHLGLVLDIPSVGFAKSILYGRGPEPKSEVTSFEYLLDPRTNERIGAQVRTKSNTKPMIISPGHRVTVDDAIELALATTRGYRVPEPTRRAHQEVNAFRRGE